MPRRARSLGLSRVMSAPSNVIAPLLTGCCPASASRRLVLPTPLRPSTQVTLPGSAESDTLRNACAAPECRSMEVTCNIALAPQIDLDHALVLRDLVDRAFGQHRTFVQAGDLDPELAHEGHVVLDHDDGAVAIDLLEEFGGLPRLGVGHAGN